MSVVALDRRKSLRRVWLSAAAVASLGGAGVGAVVAADAPAYAAEAPGPASFADVVDRVKPAVVSVKVKLADADQVDDEDFGRHPGIARYPEEQPILSFLPPLRHARWQRRRRSRRRAIISRQAQGSGFFISADGYIVTNDHVVDHATEVTITTSDGKTMPAKVIGVDTKTDLALLKAQGSDFPYVDVRRSCAARRRLGDRGRQPVRPRRNGDRRHRLGARTRHRLTGPMTTSCRSTRRSITAIPAARPSTPRARWLASTPRSSRPPAAASASASPSPATSSRTSCSSSRRTARVTRGWIGVQIQKVTPGSGRRPRPQGADTAPWSPRRRRIRRPPPQA